MTDQHNTFPQSTSLKIISRDDESTHGQIQKTLAAHLQDQSFTHKRTSSAQGRYVSTTVYFTAESQIQLQNLCTALKNLPNVMMLL